MRRFVPTFALLCLATTVACREAAVQKESPLPTGVTAVGGRAAAPADTTRADSVLAAVRATPAVAKADSARPARTAHDSAAPAAKTAAKPGAKGDSAAPAAKVKKPLVWPTWAPPRPGAVLPHHRIVAFYGNPLTTKLGVLGRIPDAQRMLDSLERTAGHWRAADTARGVQPALHLIASVAAGHPGKDGHHRTRMSDATIEQVAKWAEARGWLMFVDLQVGQAQLADELKWIQPWLARPYVHLALDPEFAMYRKPEGRRLPGRYIGTMDAADINHTVQLLGRIVDSLGLPPKVLVIHRFTDAMLTNAPKIALDPRVQVVIDMDGFGSPELKKGTWRRVIVREPVQFTGFKLFLNPKNDKPMMTPRQVLELEPAPVYIQYQ